MTDPTPARPSSGLRVAGVILLIIGVLLVVCGAGYGVAYYLTNGFFDVNDQLAQLQYGNLAVVGSGLCCGGVLAVVGGIMMAVAKRRH